MNVANLPKLMGVPGHAGLLQRELVPGPGEPGIKSLGWSSRWQGTHAMNQFDPHFSTNLHQELVPWSRLRIGFVLDIGFFLDGWNG